MSDFRTTFEIPELPKKIEYGSKILLMGSCFSENIGKKLSDYKFDVNINPFGILYNPESIAQSLEILLKGKEFSEKDLFEHEGVWNSFYHHSRFSNTDPELCLKQINKSIQEGKRQLEEIDFLLITLGTAWVYELKKTSKVVSNCHKVPAKEFSRYRLASCDIVERLKSIIKSIKNLSIGCKIILTVSPVRHLKDGVFENQISKATLLMAVNELVETMEKVYYFPSYELMMDDLRDYRFYTEDMVHPSAQAVNYIWEKFKDASIDDKCYPAMKNIEKISSAINHRPFQPKAEQYQSFLRKNLNNIEQLQSQCPGMDFSKEIAFINRNLTI